MSRILEAFSQYLDGNGDPLINGWLSFLESGSNNTDKGTFADPSLTVANANPVQLDAEGRVPNVFGTGSYRVVLFENDELLNQPGVQIDQFDPVGGESGAASFSDWDAMSVYDEGDIVTGSGGLYYRSQIPDNENNDPTTDTTNWEEIKFEQVYNANKTYAEFDRVIDNNGIGYTSLVSGNINNTPSISVDSWYRGLSNIGQEFTLGYEPTPEQLTIMGALERDGSSLLDADFPALLATWGGKLYGNADATHFYLPDDRGKFERIWDHGVGIDPDAASRTDRGDGTTGDEVGTEQAEDLLSHMHSIDRSDSLGTGGNLARGSNTSSGAQNSNAAGGNETRPINTYKFGGIFVK